MNPSPTHCGRPELVRQSGFLSSPPAKTASHAARSWAVHWTLVPYAGRVPGAKVCIAR